jgi:hypothetical protein
MSETLHTGTRRNLWMRITSQDHFRDCTAGNIMFDPSDMYQREVHTQMNRNQNFGDRTLRYTRTQRPPRYFMIGSTLSRHYHTRDVLDEPLCGSDKSAPEHNRGGTQCNPFHTDIYYLGNLVRQEFMGVREAMPNTSRR